MSLSIKFTVPKDALLTISFIFLVVCEFLPITRLIPTVLLTAGKFLAAVVFFMHVYLNDKKMAIQFIVILCIVFSVNLLAFYKCWCNYTTFGAFMVYNMLCWLYMEIGIYLLHYASKPNKIAIRNTILLLVFITAITSIISVQTVPTAIRELGNGSMNIKNMGPSLYLRNTSTWGELYAMVFLLPYIILWLKRKKNVILFIIIMVMEACVIESQITTALLLSLFFLVFLLRKPFSIKEIIVILGVLIIGSSFFIIYASELFFWLHDLVSATKNSMLTLRISQLQMLFSSGIATGTISGRFELYYISLNTFLMNPLIGFEGNIMRDFSYIGLHSQIFDLMAAVGLLGFVPLCISFKLLIQKVSQLIQDEEKRKYFFMTIVMLVLLMFINPVYYASGIFISVFWGPSIICEQENFFSMDKISMGG